MYTNTTPRVHSDTYFLFGVTLCAPIYDLVTNSYPGNGECVGMYALVLFAVTDAVAMEFVAAALGIFVSSAWLLASASHS